MRVAHRVSPGQFTACATAVLTEYSQVDIVFEQEGLLITRVLTPILARSASFADPYDKKAARQADPIPCAQQVVQCTFFAQYSGETIVASGYLTNAPVAQERQIKQTLLNGIRLNWHLFKRDKKPVSV